MKDSYRWYVSHAGKQENGFFQRLLLKWNILLILRLKPIYQSVLTLFGAKFCEVCGNGPIKEPDDIAKCDNCLSRQENSERTHAWMEMQ